MQLHRMLSLLGEGGCVSGQQKPSYSEYWGRGSREAEGRLPRKLFLVGAGVVSAGAGFVSAGAGVVSAGAGVVSTGAGVVSAGAGVVSAGAGVVSVGKQKRSYLGCWGRGRRGWSSPRARRQRCR